MPLLRALITDRDRIEQLDAIYFMEITITTQHFGEMQWGGIIHME